MRKQMLMMSWMRRNNLRMGMRISEGGDEMPKSCCDGVDGGMPPLPDLRTDAGAAGLSYKARASEHNLMLVPPLLLLRC